MSSASAGKFQDHYEVLGVEYKAQAEAIQIAYSRLADKYNPRTGTFPDAEKFESVNLAYEVLSDPELRADFDKLKGIGEEDKPKFSGRPFFEAYRRDSHLRVGLLCVLYDRRRSKPFTPALSMRHLEAIFNASTQELNFALWYLKQRELVLADDKSSLQITVSGMDYLENNPPSPELVLPMIKVAGLAGQPEEAEVEEPVEAAPTPVPLPVPSQSSVGSAARIGDLLARRKVS
ncbi:MAG: J domain-containing protein [Bryobacteraceae bacterium]